jgi:hypothetical protein
VGLDGSGFLGLGENFEQIVIGQEVETGELLSLLLEIVVQFLLNKFQILVSLLETFQKPFTGADFEHFL